MKGLIRLLKRLFFIAKAEANSGLDQIEDPIKMCEESIRELKDRLNSSMQSLAEIKSLHITERRRKEEKLAEAETIEKKTKGVLLALKNGTITQVEADKTALRLLKNKRESEHYAARHEKEAEKLDFSIDKLESSISKTRSEINSWECELTSLKSSYEVAKLTKSINKQHVIDDENSAVAVLNRMRDKIQRDEDIAEAYEQIAKDQGVDTVDDAISNSDLVKELEEMKNNLD